jgi:hypothetical protein
MKFISTSKRCRSSYSKILYSFLKLVLCMALLINYSCNSCVHGLTINNGEDVVVSAEEELSFSEEEEYLRHLDKIKGHSSSSTLDESLLEEPVLLKNLEKENPKSYKLLREFNLILKETEQEEKDYEAAYWEIIRVAKKRKSLQDGWFNYNKDMQEGFETGKFLGVISDREDFFSKHSDIIQLIDRISSFESHFKYKYREFLSGALDPKEFIDSLDDFANYAVSLTMLKSMLETKRPDGRLRYVEDASVSTKDRISQATAKKLINKVNRFLHRIEEFNFSVSEDISMLATPSNLVISKPKLEKASKLIGGRIDPEKYNPHELPMVYKRSLRPGSILWCWINSKSLREGSWNSVIHSPSKQHSVVKIMYDLMKVNYEYLRIINEMEPVLLKKDHNQVEVELSSLFSKLKSEPNFMCIHQNGKKAINLTREILAKREFYDIGRPSGKTLGLKYVGNWRRDDSSKQILEVDGRELTDILDLLSGFAVLFDSNMSMKTSLFYSKLMRQASRSNTKNPSVIDQLWFMESLEEQSKRESERKSSLGKWVGLLLILTGVSAFFPPLLPITISLLALKVGLAGVLFKA